MKTWNYRVAVETLHGERVYSIHEVFYHEDGTIAAWSSDAIEPFGETKQELTRDIQMMLEATMLDVIDLDEKGRDE